MDTGELTTFIHSLDSLVTSHHMHMAILSCQTRKTVRVKLSSCNQYTNLSWLFLLDNKELISILHRLEGTIIHNSSYREWDFFRCLPQHILGKFYFGKCRKLPLSYPFPFYECKYTIQGNILHLSFPLISGNGCQHFPVTYENNKTFLKVFGRMV